MAKSKKWTKKLTRWAQSNRWGLMSAALVLVLVGGVYLAWQRGMLAKLIKTPQDTANVALTSQDNTLPAWMPDTVKRWQGEITKQARQYNISPQLVAIIMTLESGGYPKAHSGVASGLMQVTDSTGKEIAAKFVKPARTNYDYLILQRASPLARPIWRICAISCVCRLAIYPKMSALSSLLLATMVARVRRATYTVAVGWRRSRPSATVAMP